MLVSELMFVCAYKCEREGKKDRDVSVEGDDITADCSRQQGENRHHRCI